MQFFDLSVLLRSQNPHDPERQTRVRLAIERAMVSGEFTTSVRVLQDFLYTAQERGLVPPFSAMRLLEIWSEYPVVATTGIQIRSALVLQTRYDLALLDAFIVQAALEGGCHTLHSEDLPAGMVFGALTVVHPDSVALAVHETRSGAGGNGLSVPGDVMAGPERMASDLLGQVRRAGSAHGALPVSGPAALQAALGSLPVGTDAMPEGIGTRGRRTTR